MTRKTTQSTNTKDGMEKKFRGLRRFNAIMGFLHFIQDIFMILVNNDKTYPIFTNYLGFDLATRSLTPNTQLFYELPFGPAPLPLSSFIRLTSRRLADRCPC